MKKTRWAVAVLFLLATGSGAALAAQSLQTPLAPNAIPKFVQPLPILSVAAGASDPKIATLFGNQELTISMCEFDAQVLPPGFSPTRVWGYIAGTTCPTGTQDTYIGPVIVSERATAGPSPTTVTWVNKLGSATTTGVLAYKYSTDQTIHWADPANNEANMCAHMPGYPAPGDPYGCDQNYAGPVPAVVHLHGGEVPPMIDGNPDAWVTSDGTKGPAFYSFPAAAAPYAATYKYPNVQEAAPLWFHDHTLGATRLNVYAGLAGAYLLTDNTLALPVGLDPLGLKRGSNPVDYTIPLVVQDRMFDTNGQLFFQADSAGGILWALNPEHPYWSPEFVGDSIVVNGKAWPFLNVEPKRYRFWFINGSNARTYEMFLQGGGVTAPLMYVIATDGGYLDKPAPVKKLLLMPGERYEVIVDFAGAAPGSKLTLRNTAKTPFPGGATPQGSTLGQIMQFNVTTCASGLCGAADTSYNPALGGTIRTNKAIKRLANPVTGRVGAGVNVTKTRQLTLNEIMGMPSTAVDPVTGVTTAYPGGPLEILLNNTKWDGKRITGVGTDGMFTTVSIPGYTGLRGYSLSEVPQEGETEVWEIVNTTADAHPIHLHLVQFQLINRQNYDVNAYNAAYWAQFPAGFDFTTGLTTIAGTFIPGYGPPCAYEPGSTGACNTRAYGGNPDIAAVGKNGNYLYLRDGVKPPLPQEAGWKDTVIMYPGQVTRIAVRYAPTDLPVTTSASAAYYPFNPNDGFGYVWHCHIIDHEDNEMMRPTAVTPNGGASRSLTMGLDY